MLKTALPDQHGAVKLNTTANIRLAVDLPPRCCPETTTQTPKRLPPFLGEQDAGLRFTGQSATLSDLRRGGRQFYFPSLSKFPLGFYIPHWQTASRSGQGVPKPVLLGRVRRCKGLFGTRGENRTLPLARTLLLPPRSHQRRWIQLQIFVKEGLELHTSWTWVKGTRVSIFRAFLIQFWIFAWE